MAMIVWEMPPATDPSPSLRNGVWAEARRGGRSLRTQRNAPPGGGGGSSGGKAPNVGLEEWLPKRPGGTVWEAPKPGGAPLGGRGRRWAGGGGGPSALRDSPSSVGFPAEPWTVPLASGHRRPIGRGAGARRFGCVCVSGPSTWSGD